jgi:hypothetical protein
MENLLKVLFLALTGSLLIASCADPTLLDSELLDEDQAEVAFTDTLSIKAKTVRADSLRTYSALSSEQLNSYLFGNLKDPVLGTANASIYAQLRPQFPRVDFTDATLDSIILILPYDTTGIYGSIEGTFGMDVLRAAEELPRIEDLYSDTSFTTEPTPLASIEFEPTLDSIEVLNYPGSSIDTVSFPHLRIPIEATAEMRDIFFNQDTLTYDNDSTFLNRFQGIQLKPTRETEGLLSFAMKLLGSGIYVYYSKATDTIPSQFRFELNDLTTRMVAFDKDYSGTLVETLLENPDLASDTLMFIQSMAGLNIEIDVPSITSLEGVVINKAELELTIASIEGDDLSIFEPIEQLLISRPNDDGELAVVDDVLFAGANLVSQFGGAVTDNGDNKPMTYTMNLSSHVQRMIEGTEGTSFTITPLTPAERGNRTVIYGPGHPTYGMKLKIAYTKL